MFWNHLHYLSVQYYRSEQTGDHSRAIHVELVELTSGVILKFAIRIPFYVRQNSELATLNDITTVTRKEGNVLFNDALNTFYLRLYGVRHMVKDHSDSQKGNPLPPHRLQGFFYMHHPTDRIAHTLHQSWNTGWNEKFTVTNAKLHYFLKSLCNK